MLTAATVEAVGHLESNASSVSFLSGFSFCSITLPASGAGEGSSALRFSTRRFLVRLLLVFFLMIEDGNLFQLQQIFSFHHDEFCPEIDVVMIKELWLNILIITIISNSDIE